MHCRQCMQLPAVQPIPTRCPTFSPLAAGPTSTTRPTASCPNTAGNCEYPQSLLSTEMSEWHRPQCSTCTSTSSAPSGPSSTCCRTNLPLALMATHASTVAIGVLQEEGSRQDAFVVRATASEGAMTMRFLSRRSPIATGCNTGLAGCADTLAPHGNWNFDTQRRLEPT